MEKSTHCSAEWQIEGISDIGSLFSNHNFWNVTFIKRLILSESTNVSVSWEDGKILGLTSAFFHIGSKYHLIEYVLWRLTYFEYAFITKISLRKYKNYFLRYITLRFLFHFHQVLRSLTLLQYRTEYLKFYSLLL